MWLKSSSSVTRKGPVIAAPFWALNTFILVFCIWLYTNLLYFALLCLRADVKLFTSLVSEQYKIKKRDINNMND